jgi:hypothetical protein
MVNLRIHTGRSHSNQALSLTSSKPYRRYSTSSLPSMMTLSMTLIFSVTSSQIGGVAETSSNKDGKGRHHFRRFDCSVLDSSRQRRRRRRRRRGKRGSQREIYRTSPALAVTRRATLSRIGQTGTRRRENLSGSKVKSPNLGKGREERPARSPPRQGLFIQQCYMVHYS